MIWRPYHLHVVSCLVSDSSFLILPLTHLTHLPSLRHVGLFTYSDSLVLISDLSSWLVPLIVTHHGLWLILYDLAYIRSSMYPPYSLALSSLYSDNPLTPLIPLDLCLYLAVKASSEPLNPWTTESLEPIDTLCSRRAVCPCQDITAKVSLLAVAHYDRDSLNFRSLLASIPFFTFPPITNMITTCHSEPLSR